MESQHHFHREDTKSITDRQKQLVLNDLVNNRLGNASLLIEAITWDILRRYLLLTLISFLTAFCSILLFVYWINFEVRLDFQPSQEPETPGGNQSDVLDLLQLNDVFWRNEQEMEDEMEMEELAQTFKVLRQLQFGEIYVRLLYSFVVIGFLVSYVAYLYGFHAHQFRKQRGCIRKLVKVVALREAYVLTFLMLVSVSLIPECNLVMSSIAANWVVNGPSPTASAEAAYLQQMPVMSAHSSQQSTEADHCLGGICWRSFRYAILAHSFFVGAFLYSGLYVCKYVRLNLDGPSNVTVRSVTGVIPRMVFVYVLTRVVFGQFFNFDCGFTPVVHILLVLRICTMTSDDAMNLFVNDITCAEYPAKLVFILVVTMMELGILGYTVLEFRRTWDYIRSNSLLEGRRQFSTFIGYGIHYSFTLLFLIICEVGLLYGSPLPVIQVSPTTVPRSLVTKRDDYLVYLYTTTFRIAIFVVVLNYCFWLIVWTLPRRVMKKSSNYAAVTYQGYIEEEAFEPADNETSVNPCFTLEECCLNYNLAYITKLVGNASYSQTNAEVQRLVDERDDFNLVVHEQVLDSRSGILCIVFKKLKINPLTGRQVLTDIFVTFKGGANQEYPDQQSELGAGSEHGLPYEDIRTCYRSSFSGVGESVASQKGTEPSLNPKDLPQGINQHLSEDFSINDRDVFQSEADLISFFSEPSSGHSRTQSRSQQQFMYLDATQKALVDAMTDLEGYLDVANSSSFVQHLEQQAPPATSRPLRAALLKTKLCGETVKKMLRRDLYIGYLKVICKVVKAIFNCCLQHYDAEESFPTVYCTGENLGASLASLCALDLKVFKDSIKPNDDDLYTDPMKELFPNIAVYAFGVIDVFNNPLQAFYRTTVRHHFEIVSAMDSQLPHLFSWRPYRSLGKLILLESSGNIILLPDWLELSILRIVNSNDVYSNRGRRYTESLMHWSFRTRYTFSDTSLIRLWPGVLYEVLKQRSYPLADDLLGYFEEISSNIMIEDNNLQLQSIMCLEVSMIKITDIEVRRVYCLVSCGHPGVDSRHWELSGTREYELCGEKKHRYNVNTIRLPSEVSPAGGRNTIAASMSTPTGLSTISSSTSVPRFKHAYTRSFVSSVKEYYDFSPDIRQATPMGSLSWLDLQDGNPTNHRRKNTLEAAGKLREDDSFLKPASTIHFTEHDSLRFGQFQTLVPSSRITIAAVDCQKQEIFGTASISLREILPLQREDGQHTEPAKELQLYLSGRTHKFGNQPKVVFTVRSIGGKHLNELTSLIDSDAEEDSGEEDFMSVANDQEVGLKNLKSTKEKSKGLVISSAMANYYLAHNYNRETRRVLLTVGIMRARIKPATVFGLKSIQAVEDLAPSFFVEALVGKQIGTTWKSLSKQRASSNLQLEWNTCLQFGRGLNLSGFEDITICLKSRVQQPVQGGSAHSEGLARFGKAIQHNLQTEVSTIGKVFLRFGSILAKCENPKRTDPLLRWLPLYTKVGPKMHSSTDLKSVSQNASLSRNVLVGHICLIFHISTERFDLDFNIAKNYGSQSRPSKSLQRKLRSTSNAVKKRRPRRTSSMSTMDMSHEDNMSRNEVLGAPTSSMVKAKNVSPAWVQQSVQSTDDRKFSVTLQLLQGHILGSVTEEPEMHSYCVVEVINRESGAIQAKKLTAVVQGSHQPCYNECFVFGEDRKFPVQGNETLRIQIYRWTKDNPANLLAQHSISLKKITASELEKVPVEKLSLPVMTNAVDLQGPEEATLSLMYKICIKSFRTEGTEHTKLRNR